MSWSSRRESGSGGGWKRPTRRASASRCNVRWLRRESDVAQLAAQQSRVIEAAQAAGLSHIVKLSGSDWTIKPAGFSLSGDAHGHVEQFLQDSGISHVVLRPNARTGNCPFFEADACTIHAARPLACALYPLGQAIDPATAAMEYYVQLPLCGARVSAQEQRTLQNYLDDAAITARAGIDARWAVVCTQLSDKLQQAGGRENPRYLPAARRIARALYFDYSIQDDFYPQFNANTQALWPLLDKML